MRFVIMREFFLIEIIWLELKLCLLHCEFLNSENLITIMFSIEKTVRKMFHMLQKKKCWIYFIKKLKTMKDKIYKMKTWLTSFEFFLTLRIWMCLLRISKILLHFLTMTCNFFMLSMLTVFENIIYFRFFNVLMIWLKKNAEFLIIFLNLNLKNEYNAVFRQFELKSSKLRSKIIEWNIFFW